MSEAGQSVVRKFQFGSLAPRSIATVRGHNLGIARIGRVGGTLSEIHGSAIGREGTSALVVVGIYPTLHNFGLAPFSLIVFFAKEYVAWLSACNAAKFVALSIVASGGEI